MSIDGGQRPCAASIRRNNVPGLIEREIVPRFSCAKRSMISANRFGGSSPASAGSRPTVEDHLPTVFGEDFGNLRYREHQVPRQPAMIALRGMPSILGVRPDPARMTEPAPSP